MKLSEEDYNFHANQFDGYCSKCDDVTQFGMVEPDAVNYKCPDCENNTMMGIEEAMLQGLIEII